MINLAIQTLGTTAINVSCQLCCLSLQRVLGLTSLDGVLNPAHVSGKHIVHNVFSVNRSGIVILENKAGVYSFIIGIVYLQRIRNFDPLYLLLHLQRTCLIGW